MPMILVTSEKMFLRNLYSLIAGLGRLSEIWWSLLSKEGY